MFVVNTNNLGSLNPFYFRAGLLLNDKGAITKDPCLNPFYFRAGLLQTGKGEPLWSKLSLNPFYFRAGLLRWRASAEAWPPMS